MVNDHTAPKPFHLFAGQEYYAGPMLDDYEGGFATREEAAQYIMDSLAAGDCRWDWWCVATFDAEGELRVEFKQWARDCSGFNDRERAPINGGCA